MRRYKKWLILVAAVSAVAVAGLAIAGLILSRRAEPYIRQQAIEYLEHRFNADVELASLEVHMPSKSVFEMLWTRGKGAIADVEGTGLQLRLRGRPDEPVFFKLAKFRFGVDLGLLLASPRMVPWVQLDGVEINVPPKGARPRIAGGEPNDSDSSDGKSDSVIIDQIEVTNAKLNILPRDKSKTPLHFDIQRVHLQSAGTRVAMKYDAVLTNPKPPGQINSKGSFGPWNAADPGDTALDGEYLFQKADLSVFKGIAGILRSTGKFRGTLSSIDVEGEATVPDFRLKRANNPVPLKTRFQVKVDGTNGNTTLQPVVARLGVTDFTTSGGIVKHERDSRRTISLEAHMPNGQLADVLRLAMKGEPFMEGIISLDTKVDVPPLSGKVKEKLMLDGRFTISQGKIRKSHIQEKIDGLSRRGQGQPSNREIDEVLSNIVGVFKMQEEVIQFDSLSFAVPGAAIGLEGSYDLGQDAIDFRGALKLNAKVSETMSGWKRWILKPVDPFFAKNGAGTFLRIKIQGTKDDPKFGLDRGGGNKSVKKESGGS
jgi:hypothetical protein